MIEPGIKRVTKRSKDDKIVLVRFEMSKKDYPNIDKEWLKYYSVDDIKGARVPNETMYEYMMKNNSSVME